MNIETIRHDEIMDKLRIIEIKNDNIFKNGYVIIDKYFVYDVIMYACIGIAIIWLTANYFNFI